MQEISITGSDSNWTKTLFNLDNMLEESNNKLVDSNKEAMLDCVDQLIMYDKNIDTYIEATNKIIERLKNNIVVATENKQKLHDSIKTVFESHDLSKVKTALGAITVCKNSKPITVDVDKKNIDKIPDKYKQTVTKTEVKVNKELIKQDYEKNKKPIDGTTITVNETYLKIT